MTMNKNNHLSRCISYQKKSWISQLAVFSLLEDIYIYICIYIPRTQLTSIFEGQLSKTRPFSIKTRGPIWVLGIYIYIYQMLVWKDTRFPPSDLFPLDVWALKVDTSRLKNTAAVAWRTSRFVGSAKSKAPRGKTQSKGVPKCTKIHLWHTIYSGSVVILQIY